ncbi:MAG: hypothetical protein MI863_21540 [Desulfobacterales bacterium]|nr:hypothetical protein [Desulfobacterales bacterium]
MAANNEELLILKNMDVQKVLDEERAAFGCVNDYNRLLGAGTGLPLPARIVKTAVVFY